RKLAMPHATTPSDATVPTTSTTAAAMSAIRNALRPPGESEGGGVAGGEGAMVVIRQSPSGDSGFEVAQHRQHAAVLGLAGSQVQLGEDRRDVLFGGTDGHV